MQRDEIQPISENSDEHDAAGELFHLGEKILATVRQFCCFGSWNKSSTLQAAKQFDRLQKAVALVIQGEDVGVKKKLDDFFKISKNRRLKRRLNQIKNEAQEDAVLIMLLKDSVGGNVKAGQRQFQLPLHYYVDVDLLKIVYACFPRDYFKWTQEAIDHLSPFIATYLREYRLNHANRSNTEKESMAKFISAASSSNNEVANEGIFIDQFNRGEEFASQKQQALFIKQTIKDVKNGPALFGVGNCGLMTDCAFLAALSLDLSDPITYIRFVGSDSHVDMINAIAIGEWPNPGCLIVSPWQGMQGMVYLWQGEVITTPEIMRLGPYDQVKVIFRINPSIYQDKKCKAKLTEHGYANWLTLPQREHNLDEIRQFSSSFLKAMTAVGYIEKSNDNNDKTAIRMTGRR